MKLQTIMGSALGALSMAIMPAAVAGNTFDDHYHLYQTLHRHGITVAINPMSCAKGFDGMYQPFKRLLTICQDRARPGQGEVEWTANDYDTLRHEAQHFIQDCNMGTNHDGELQPLFNDADLNNFVGRTIGHQQAQMFLNSPAYAGLDDNGRKLEAEAFAVAAAIDARDIADKVTQICGRNHFSF